MATTPEPRKNHTSKIQSVPLLKMIVATSRAQRVLKEHWVNHLLAEFDLDQFGLPTLNLRGARYYIIDGQHRIEALKRWLGEGWQTQHVECRVYTGMSEPEEADMFDRLNDVLVVGAFDKFKVRVTAGREVELDIQRIVQAQNLVISRAKMPGGIGAVATLKKVYVRSNRETLRRTLRIICNAFGDAGFEALVIDGVGLLCQRYNGLLAEERATQCLGNTRGGARGLLGKAEVLHKQTGNARSHCVAAAAVEVINAKRGGSKLPSWWKTQQLDPGLAPTQPEP